MKCDLFFDELLESNVCLNSKKKVRSLHFHQNFIGFDFGDEIQLTFKTSDFMNFLKEWLSIYDFKDISKDYYKIKSKEYYKKLNEGKVDELNKPVTNIEFNLEKKELYSCNVKITKKFFLIKKDSNYVKVDMFDGSYLILNLLYENDINWTL
ncbi:MAG: hypothetical protein ACOCRX_07335 [Candidatus Woesearchaeota archaeon]